MHIGSAEKRRDMIKKNLLRSISVIMACMMAVMTVACGSNTVATEDTASAVETRQEQQLEKSIVAGAQAAGSLGEAGKVETVYVTADASGSVNDVIVSEWLKNATASSELTDTTELKDIVNVKGDESFTENGDGTVTWNADGSDIYYQGTTDKELPVDMKITYTLDGKEISPADLAGKSGKVTIRFEYENKAKQTVDVDGKNIDVYTPFAMVSGMMLDSDKFSNVEISNGKIISDGGNYIVMGVALPGLKESLDISDDKWDELDDSKELQDKLSNSFEITADTTDFELGMTITMASSDILSDFGVSDLTDSDKIDDLKDDMNELNDGSDKLVDGAGELKDGTGKLYDGTQELVDGTGKLYDGTKDLKDGTGKLKDGTGKLKDGTGKLKDGTTKLANGAGELVNGAGQLAEGTGTLKNGTSQLSTGAGSLYEGIVAYTDGVSKVNSGAGELSKGAASAKAGSEALSTGIKSAMAGADQLAAGTEKLSGGANMLQQKITAMSEASKGALESLQNNRDAYAAAYAYLTTPGVGCDATTLAILSKCSKGNITADNVEAVKAAGLAYLGGQQSGEVHQEDNGAELDQDIEGGDIPAPNTDETVPADKEKTDTVETLDENKKEEVPVNTIASIQDDETPKADAPDNADDTNNGDNNNNNDNGGNPATGYSEEQVKAMVDAAVNEALAKAAEEYAKQAEIAKEAAEKEYAERAAAAKEDAEKLYAEKAAAATQTATYITIYMSAFSATSAAVETMDQVLANLSTMGISETDMELIKQLIDGVSAVDAGSKQLQAGLGQLDEGATRLDTGLGTLKAGTAQLATGIGTLAASNEKLRSGASQLKSGAGQLDDGAGKLKDGANKLTDGTKQLKSGADELNSGAGELDNGAGELDNGAGELDNGASELMDGAKKLNDGAGELNDGAKKLDDGVQELLDGICKFDEEGIKKLYEAFDGDLTEFADKMTAIQEAGSNYTSFGGASTEEKSSVKFIIKTEGVKAQDI
ncbi:cell surface protein [Butyrivibrio proteoclasticus B316]|uniref:Cell surface protein n=2 Tax=Butyrivibrio proteoclasticus TaxID=43305 RepID=E0RVJ3_BUTPB|nr:cell surface protein [Butyrivibrio proteoclasticus B316]